MNEETFIPLNEAVDHMALWLWPVDASQEEAIAALDKMKATSGFFTPVYAARMLAKARITKQIEAFIDDGRLDLVERDVGQSPNGAKEVMVSAADLRKLLATPIQPDEYTERDLRAVINLWNTTESHERRLIDIHASQRTEPLDLHEWFRRDNWTPDEALRLLLGLSPGDFFADAGDHETSIRIVSARYLDGSLVSLEGWKNANVIKDILARKPEYRIYDDELPITSFELLHLSVKLSGMQTIWNSGDHASRNPPAYYIAWARKKGYEVPWLDWARSQGLIDGEATEATIRQPALRSASSVDSSSPSALPTPVIAKAFDGLNGWDSASWAKSLGDGRAKWLEAARKSKGRKGAAPATWDPIAIALALMNKGDSLAKLDAVFKKAPLRAWRGKWEDDTEVLRG